MADNLPRRLLTPAEVSEHYIPVTESTLAHWRISGRGPRFVKAAAGRRAPVFYDPADVAAWIEDNRRQNTAEAAA